jgi:hypothetical protein
MTTSSIVRHRVEGTMGGYDSDVRYRFDHLLPGHFTTWTHLV